MAAVDSDESDFGDDMALVPSMKAHTGGQGLQSRQRTSFNAAELAVPKILHQMLCTAASDQVVAALGCGEREIVFAGSGGLLYSSYDGPNTEITPAVEVFYAIGQWKYVTNQPIFRSGG